MSIGASAAAQTVALMIETDGPGGAEVVLLELAEELRRRGHEVVPVGPERGFGWLSGQLRERGFRPETFALRRPLDWGCVTSLRGAFARRGVTVVHSHEFTMAVYGSAAARLSGLRHIVTMHGEHPAMRTLKRRVALRWAVRGSHAVVAVSHATKRELGTVLGGLSRSIRVIHNGVVERPGNAAPVRAELRLEPGELLIVAVGNLEPWKAHIVLLRALKQLLDEGLNVRWRVVIAGGRGGSERERLDGFIREHDLTKRVHLLLHRSDVPDLLAAAEVFCMPSLREGLPLALLEAMFSSTAIIASSTSGIPEALTADREALLVPPGDQDALARGLRRLLTSPDERVRLAAAARRRAVGEFTIARMADSYLQLYTECS
jgi:glycosyltransferase involved in cell wall biosynthesis